MTKESQWFRRRPYRLSRSFRYVFSDRLWMDLYEVYHRGRYGWASSDVWSLDGYLADILAGTLNHLAKHSHGAPAGYPNESPNFDDEIETDFEQWYADLRRDARAFEDYNWWYREGMIGDFPSVEAFFAVEQWHRDRLVKAMSHMSQWYGGLWD